ncbi:glycerol-3-phosphate dehydrogenase/oxidase [uncultured Jatrophihabitans sp.]|uniref:glycerol-3-phosphate dehydrogenase/oxidase n=1 Tax=uncultured Jatrophihabitans sp. TaxID=1610747 RepID=UPI0035C9674E
MSTALDAARRARELDELTSAGTVDVLVIGGGVTGAGVALDAATRGLRTVLVESRDWAFGTSRWSSKLVHGGLRYLAAGRVGVAWESAVERGVLMTRTAPHLVRALPTVVPLFDRTPRRQQALIHAGFLAGDALRVAARTPAGVLPRARLVSPTQARALAPAIASAGLRGGLVAYDGQLIDDARLVVGLARTAADAGAVMLTRVRAEQVTGTSARLVDTRTGATTTLAARAVINAAGVWAGDVDPSVRLRPSRGTHLVLPAAAFGNPTASITVPIPGSLSRYVFAMPEQLGRVYVGLTDEDAPGPIPDEPQATDAEIDFLLATVNTALGRALTRTDVLGCYAGLRPLVDTGAGSTADLSRQHLVSVGPTGVVSVLGGKLTTYRRMAQDAVDQAVSTAALRAGPCRTREVALVGAAKSASTAGLPAALVARYGGESRAVVEGATLRDPLGLIAEGMDVTRAEIEHAVTHEGALDVADVLDRRTRIGLVPADADRARDAVGEIVAALLG